ncbi:nudix hydrolase 8 [Cocos nucifera]|uniref:Nudix hydrolase 8 n=1 Tax=Cocos nucifera TaxID=13894 RepID=A0A8K0ILG6_COCNU|nr:nudix hydrolase 8 [Cocos nucifera]
MKVSYSISRSSSEDIDSTAPGKFLKGDSSIINGSEVAACLWPPARGNYVLDAYEDEYGGIIIKSEGLPWNANEFASSLRASLSQWKVEAKKGVWLKLPLDRSDFVPIAVKEGFKYHHAEQKYVMLTYWIPEGPCLLPGNASHQVGVGGFVMNDKNEVLVVQEKYCASTFAGLWKLPTGFILESEEIFSGAVREVEEETGRSEQFFAACSPYFLTILQIDTEFVEVIAFRHAHHLAFGKSDLFFICMLRPLSSQIKIDELEIQAAKWMPLSEFVEQPSIQGDNMFKKIIDICIARLGKRYCGLAARQWMPLSEFVEQPSIQGDNMFKKIIDICIARLGKRYCGLAARQVISKFDGRSSSLYYNVVEPQDFNCQGT